MTRPALRRLTHLLICLALVAVLDFLSSNESVVSAPQDTESIVVAASLYSDVYTVTRVVDGDTIEVKDETGKLSKVRLIGINTPETVDPRKTVQCFGKEASNRTKTLLMGQIVNLKADPTQDNSDKYGRILRYVFLSDGTDVNLSLIRDGYAYEYTYRTPYQHQIAYKAAQIEARTAERGLWAPGTCAGKL